MLTFHYKYTLCNHYSQPIRSLDIGINSMRYWVLQMLCWDCVDAAEQHKAELALSLVCRKMVAFQHNWSCGHTTITTRPEVLEDGSRTSHSRIHYHRQDCYACEHKRWCMKQNENQLRNNAFQIYYTCGHVSRIGYSSHDCPEMEIKDSACSDCS